MENKVEVKKAGGNGHKTNWLQVLKNQLALIVADTNEVQVSLADGGFTDLLIDAIKAETALIVADTNEIQVSLADGGFTDLLIDTIIADTNEIQVSLADGGFTDLLIDAIKAETALIVADTNEVQVSLADGGFTDLLIDAIKAETALIVADTNEIQVSLADGGFTDLLIDAIKGVVDDILADTATIAWGDITTIDGIVDDILADTADMQPKLGKMLFSMDFWSDPQEEIAVPGAAATLVFTPTVSVEDLPGTATIVRAIAMFKFRMVENTYEGVNALDGATDPDTTQVIQVKETTAGAYIDAINFADNQFTLASQTREGGDVLIGSIDIVGQVDANGSYTFQWKMRKCDQDFINFNDCQVGLRIWYSV